MKNIAIIVLNWQGWRDTLVCLTSLKQLAYAGFVTIIVCDNASGDESVERILTWAQENYASWEIGQFEYLADIAHFQPLSGITQSPNFQFGVETSNQCQFGYSFVFIQTGANLGFAGGNNVGIVYALQHRLSYDYLWLLNNDTYVDSQALTALSQYALAHPRQALIGSTLIHWEERDIVQCAGGCHYFPWLTVFRQVYSGKPLETVMQYDEDKIKLDYVCGAALFLTTAAVRQIGLLNESYFLFYEELDYTQRLKQQSYEIGWCKNSWVYHKGSASVGSVKEGNREKLQRANYYENLSTLKYTARFYPHLLPMVMILRAVLKALALLSRGDFYLFPPLFQAYHDFFCQMRKNQ